MTDAKQMQLKTAMLKEIQTINDYLLHPDSMCWGKMTPEEADNVFNDVNDELYEEWGNKSFNILYYIDHLKSDEIVTMCHQVIEDGYEPHALSINNPYKK